MIRTLLIACVVVFDNWRVLHGRSAFEGLRRICGAYSKCFALNNPYLSYVVGKMLTVGT